MSHFKFRYKLINGKLWRQSSFSYPKMTIVQNRRMNRSATSPKSQGPIVKYTELGGVVRKFAPFAPSFQQLIMT